MTNDASMDGNEQPTAVNATRRHTADTVTEPQPPVEERQETARPTPPLLHKARPRTPRSRSPSTAASSRLPQLSASSTSSASACSCRHPVRSTNQDRKGQAASDQIPLTLGAPGNDHEQKGSSHSSTSPHTSSSSPSTNRCETATSCAQRRQLDGKVHRPSESVGPHTRTDGRHARGAGRANDH